MTLFLRYCGIRRIFLLLLLRYWVFRPGVRRGGGGGAVFQKQIWWGCVARLPNPYLRPKSTIFPTLFKTCLNLRHAIYDRCGRHSCPKHNFWRTFVYGLINNDEEAASSKTQTQVKTRAQKLTRISLLFRGFSLFSRPDIKLFILQRIIKQLVGAACQDDNCRKLVLFFWDYFQPSNQTLKDNSKNPGSWFQEVTFEGHCYPNLTAGLSIYLCQHNNKKPEFRFLSRKFLVELFLNFLFWQTLNANVYGPPYFVYLSWLTLIVPLQLLLLKNSVYCLLKPGLPNNR